MSQVTENKDNNEEIVSSIHAFSYEAFDLAKAFVAGSEPEPLKQKASDLKTRVPKFAAKMREAEEAYRPDLNRVLSEARLDLDYVLGGGGRPSSIRLGHVMREQAAT